MFVLRIDCHHLSLLVARNMLRNNGLVNLLLAGILGCLPVHAGDVMEAEVIHESGVYTLSLEAWISAPAPRVHHMLTDYTHLERVNPAVKESEIINSNSPVHHRVRTLIEACIAFFCKQLIQVWDVEQQSDYVIVAAIVPELSNFRSGNANWVLSEEGGGTRLRFTTQLEPSFWVPPLIGPWLIRYKLRKEALESVDNLEQLGVS